MSHNPNLAYRPDIDGLRAIAVLAVVLYHFGIGRLDGGFVGVDVFFVISGFLITGIIQREIEQGKFTFVGFYERRIRRIFPALFFMLAATLALSYFLLLPSDLVLLGKSTLATLVFGSNIFFWRTSGYFNPESDLNPLLHTWSLAVEEQFYIGLPFVLLAVWRWKRDWLSPVLIGAMAVSFALCLWVMQKRPDAGFYLSPFRGWELLVGGILAIRRKSILWGPWLRELVAWLSFSMLAASLWLIQSGSDFPGWQAWVPVVATAGLIYIHGSGETSVSKLLSLKPMVWVGLISYSLYLWHWPVLYFLNYLNAFEPINNLAWLGVVISIVIAFVSSRYVEKPFRENKQFFTRKVVYTMAICASMILAFAALFFWKSAGMPCRFSEAIQALDKERNPYIPFKECDTNSVIDGKLNDRCIIGDKTQKPTLIVWGDSHAMSIAPALDSIFKKKRLSAIVSPNSGCPGILNLEIANDSDCRSQNESVLRFIRENRQIKTVVLHSYWGFYTGNNSWKLSKVNGVPGLSYLGQSLDLTVEKLNRLDKNVIVIGQVATSPTTPTAVVLQRTFKKHDKAPFTYTEFKEINNDFSNALSKVSPGRKFRYIDLSSYMCSSGKCSYMINAKNMYRDTDHLSISGARYLEPYLENELLVDSERILR